jgi:hypothetical protein
MKETSVACRNQRGRKGLECAGRAGEGRERSPGPLSKRALEVIDVYERSAIGHAIFKTWDARDIDELVPLMRKFVDAIKDEHQRQTAGLACQCK